MACGPPGSSVNRILQTRILEWVAISYSRGSSWPRDWTWVSCIVGKFFTIWATRDGLIIIIFNFIYLVLTGLSLHCCVGFSLLAESWGYTLLRWLLLWWSMGSGHAGFSSCDSWALRAQTQCCGTWAQLLRSTWDLPRPGMEPMSLALAGRFISTESSGKPLASVLIVHSAW